MTVSPQKISPSVLNAACALLLPGVPELSPATLIEALKAYQAESAPKTEKPLTRRQVADLLSCSLQTVSRMIGDGRLTASRIGGHSVRILPESVRRLMNTTEEE